MSRIVVFKDDDDEMENSQGVKLYIYLEYGCLEVGILIVSKEKMNQIME